MHRRPCTQQTFTASFPKKPELVELVILTLRRKDLFGVGSLQALCATCKSVVEAVGALTALQISHPADLGALLSRPFSANRMETCDIRWPLDADSASRIVALRPANLKKLTLRMS